MSARTHLLKHMGFRFELLQHSSLLPSNIMMVSNKRTGKIEGMGREMVGWSKHAEDEGDDAADEVYFPRVVLLLLSPFIHSLSSSCS